MDVPGDDAALRAPDLAVVCRLAYRRPTGFAHACSSSLGVLYDGRRTLARFDARPTSAGCGGRGSLSAPAGHVVHGGEVEVAVVGPEPLGHHRSGGAPEHRRVATRPPEGEAAEEPRGEGIPATGGVDHIHLKRRDGLAPLLVDD